MIPTMAIPSLCQTAHTGDGNRDIEFLGKAITLRSENGPENCIIDCNGTLAEKHRGFYFHSQEDSNSVLAGFTVTNGYGLLWYPFPVPAGGAIFCKNSSPRIANCIIKNSTGGFGGGILCHSSSPVISDCTVSSNSAVEGGGMYNYENSCVELINCTFSGNSAEDGGGVNCNYSVTRLNNCTFSGNRADRGNTLACDTSFSYPSTVLIANCILRDGSSGIWNNDSSSIIITYSDIRGGWSGPGGNNIDADPCFADQGYWDDPCNTPGDFWDDVWIDGDYHLKSQASRWDANSESWVQDAVTSPCIDAGNPGCPLADEPAPNGNRRNMGAYGGTAEASKSPINWRSIADLTNDWVVDSNDLKVFVGYWLQMGECIPGDLNRDQSANSADFALLAMHWLRDENQ